MRAVGVHCYAGGFTLGVRRAGFEADDNFETSAFGVATAEKNLAGLKCWVSKSQWAVAIHKIRQQGVNIDFVYANPPCAPWSSAGAKLKSTRQVDEPDRWRTDDRVKCIEDCLQILWLLKPHVWVWESVAALWSKGRNLIDDVAKRGAQKGYATTAVLFDAMATGLPQRRKRCFVVLHDVGLICRRPRHKPVTVREALAGVKRTDNISKVSDRLRTIISLTRQGEKLLKGYERMLDGKEPELNDHGLRVGAPGFLHTRLDWNAPACTITGGCGFYHPEENRPLTVEEQGVLCGYPKNWKWVGTNMNDLYAQTARCVTPQAGEWIARQAFESIERGRGPSSFNMGKPRLVDFLHDKEIDDEDYGADEEDDGGNRDAVV